MTTQRINGIARHIKDSYEKIAQIQGAPRCTPVTYSDYFSQLVNGDVYFKHEQFQSTGSFKYRGAFTKLQHINSHTPGAQVVAGSSGNHGIAVAKAAELLGITATIFIPQHTSPLKISKIKSFGADIETVPGDCLLAETSARAFASNNNAYFISPYNDIDVLAGQGGIAVELENQLDHIDAVFASVGGGGLIGGIGSYLKATKQENPVAIVGCWPENSPILHQCLSAGKIISVPEIETLSDGTAGDIEKDSITLGLCQAAIDYQVLVSEVQIKSAMGLALEQEGIMIEGAAGVALAGLIKLKDQFAGKTSVVILCGRNVSFEVYKEAILESNTHENCSKR